jgi:cytochrome c oxidase cbb3-type subunit 3
MGSEKFATVCAACHGPDGKGNPMLGAPNLTDQVWIYGGSLETIVETVANGRQNRMPAWGELLGEQKVRLLAAYVYSLSPPPPSATN